MYDYLEGTVARVGAASATLDLDGVGYSLLVPLGTAMPPVGERARLWVHLVVREDRHALYGFAERETRDLFRHLLSVKGVGPAMALAVLSGITRAELVDAILRGDARRLTTVKGVGKKTAEQILLDLRDKPQLVGAGLEAGAVPGARGPAVEGAGAQLEDAVGALVALGFSERDARKRVERAAQKVGSQDLNQLVQAAFRG